MGNSYDIKLTGFEEGAGDPTKGLTRAFGISRERAASLVRKIPTTVKSNASLKEVENYVKALERIGARIEIIDAASGDVVGPDGRPRPTGAGDDHAAEVPGGARTIDRAGSRTVVGLPTRTPDAPETSGIPPRLRDPFRVLREPDLLELDTLMAEVEAGNQGAGVDPGDISPNYSPAWDVADGLFTRPSSGIHPAPNEIDPFLESGDASAVDDGDHGGAVPDADFDDFQGDDWDDLLPPQRERGPGGADSVADLIRDLYGEASLAPPHDSDLDFEDHTELIPSHQSAPIREDAPSEPPAPPRDERISAEPEPEPPEVPARMEPVPRLAVPPAAPGRSDSYLGSSNSATSDLLTLADSVPSVPALAPATNDGYFWSGDQPAVSEPESPPMRGTASTWGLELDSNQALDRVPDMPPLLEGIRDFEGTDWQPLVDATPPEVAGRARSGARTAVDGGDRARISARWWVLAGAMTVLLVVGVLAVGLGRTSPFERVLEGQGETFLPGFELSSVEDTSIPPQGEATSIEAVEVGTCYGWIASSLPTAECDLDLTIGRRGQRLHTDVSRDGFPVVFHCAEQPDPLELRLTNVSGHDCTYALGRFATSSPSPLSTYLDLYLAGFNASIPEPYGRLGGPASGVLAPGQRARLEVEVPAGECRTFLGVSQQGVDLNAALYVSGELVSEDRDTDNYPLVGVCAGNRVLMGTLEFSVFRGGADYVWQALDGEPFRGWL